MYKLSDIFNADNIKQKRKILSNFPITREDRNKTLVASGEGSSSEGGFTYKSRKVVWRVDTSKENIKDILNIFIQLPFYCVGSRFCDGGHEYINKAYGSASTAFIQDIITKLYWGLNTDYIYIFRRM